MFKRRLAVAALLSALVLVGCSSDPAEVGDAPGYRSQKKTVDSTPFEIIGPGQGSPTTLPEGFFNQPDALGNTTTSTSTTTTIVVPDSRVPDPGQNDPVCIASQTILTASLAIRQTDSTDAIRAGARTMADAMGRAATLIDQPAVNLALKAQLANLFRRVETGARVVKDYNDVNTVGAMIEHATGADAAALAAFKDYASTACPPPVIPG